jgi:hypothetical protein
VGEWKDDDHHGKGTVFYANGATYEGDWICGKMHGTGTLTAPNGTKYEGGFKDNLPHGKGTQTDHEGNSYVIWYNAGLEVEESKAEGIDLGNDRRSEALADAEKKEVARIAYLKAERKEYLNRLRAMKKK